MTGLLRAALLCLSATTFGGTTAVAQETLEPLSAIDWFKQSLSQTIETPKVAPSDLGSHLSEIDVSVLSAPVPDGVGLISSAVSGFAPTIWSASSTQDLQTILDGIPVPRVPAVSILLTRLMLTEAESPQGPAGAFLKARVETLTRLGNVEPAIALLERADPESDPQLFRQWADLKLYFGEDRDLCDALLAKPELAPSYDYRVYCLSRTGDWPTAATTLLAAEVLGEIDPNIVMLLTRYLDPEIFEGVPLQMDPDFQMTPLAFRLLEGIGEPWPTDSLPLAYAESDLRGLVGWHAQITAAERLSRTGAVSENRLLGIYSANRPSASGGVWTRVADIQALDQAIQSRDPNTTYVALNRAWTSFHDVGLRFVLANLYGDMLVRMNWPSQESAALAHKVELLSRTYQGLIFPNGPIGDFQKFLDAIAQGKVADTSYPGVLPSAIRKGFTAPPSQKYTDMLARNADGQALLSAIAAVAGGRDSYPSDIADAIAVFRVLGLTDTARQFALQLLLNEM